MSDKQERTRSIINISQKGTIEYNLVDDYKKILSCINGILQSLSECNNDEIESKEYYLNRLTVIYVSAYQYEKKFETDISEEEKTKVDKILTKIKLNLTSISESDLKLAPEEIYKSNKKNTGESNEKAPARKVKPYSSNFTHSLKTSFKSKSITLADRIEEYSDMIKEHASRRVELFFYLCIALYKSKLTIKIDETDKQHGQGSKSVCLAACHSSLFTSIKCAEENGDGTFKPIFDGTQFAETLNSTVELPVCVNNFDSFCEGKNTATNDSKNKGLRLLLLPVLQRLSNGEISPIDAMEFYFKEFEKRITSYNVEEIKNNNVKTCYPTPKNVKERIRNLQRQGTFYWADFEGKKLSGQSIKTLLFMHHKQHGTRNLIERRYSVIKKELFESNFNSKNPSPSVRVSEG